MKSHRKIMKIWNVVNYNINWLLDNHVINQTPSYFYIFYRNSFFKLVTFILKEEVIKLIRNFKHSTYHWSLCDGALVCVSVARALPADGQVPQGVEVPTQRRARREREVRDRHLNIFLCFLSFFLNDKLWVNSVRCSVNPRQKVNILWADRKMKIRLQP